MAEMEGGVMTRCFVRGAGIAEGTGDVIGEIIGTEESNAHPLFYFANHRGDPMAAYVQHDTTKTLAAEYRYDAFGNLISSTTNEPSFAPRFTFSTKEYLAEAQLYLYAYRVYDPVAGRWTQRDPIDYEDSPNLYQFCRNNPTTTTDTLGQLGSGFYAGATIEAGIVYGAGACVFGGAGIFAPDLSSFLKPETIESGTFTGGGAFVGGPGKNLKAPAESTQEPEVGGAYAGVGGGVFITNAKNADELKGPFNEWHFNLPFVSVSFGISGDTWIGSITYGPGAIASGSGYPTTTNPTRHENPKK